MPIEKHVNLYVVNQFDDISYKERFDRIRVFSFYKKKIYSFLKHIENNAQKKKDKRTNKDIHYKEN